MAYTYEQVKHFVEVESNSSCKLLSDKYINYTTNLKFLCKCGNEFEARFSNFKNNNKRQCNKCGTKSRVDSHRLKYEDVKYFIEVKSGSDCKLLTEGYKNNKTKLKLRCKCGREFSVGYDKFKSSNKRQCNICSKVHFDYAYVKEFIEGESECKLLSNSYQNLRTQLQLKCGCGEVFYTTFDYFKNHNKRQCDFCGFARFTHEEVKNYISKHSECKLLSEEYKNNNTKMLFKCSCGNIFKTDLDNFKTQYKRQCNECSLRMSRGELRVEAYLKNNAIEFISEYSFGDCRNKEPLPFDFYIPKHNLLIEYDGEQHFEPVDFAGKGDEWALEGLKGTQHNDNIKSQYCKDNGISLLRIPYWDFDSIEQVLSDKLTDR